MYDLRPIRYRAAFVALNIRIKTENGPLPGLQTMVRSNAFFSILPQHCNEVPCSPKVPPSQTSDARRKSFAISTSVRPMPVSRTAKRGHCQVMRETRSYGITTLHYQPRPPGNPGRNQTLDGGADQAADPGRKGHRERPPQGHTCGCARHRRPPDLRRNGAQQGQARQ